MSTQRKEQQAPHDVSRRRLGQLQHESFRASRSSRTVTLIEQTPALERSGGQIIAAAQWLKHIPGRHTSLEASPELASTPFAATACGVWSVDT